MIEMIIQLICGAVGGNVAGAALKKFNLGPIGNTIAGVVGGGIGGQVLGMLGFGAPAAGSAGSMDVSSILSSVLGGGVGGGFLMTLVGMIKNALAKK